MFTSRRWESGPIQPFVVVLHPADWFTSELAICCEYDVIPMAVMLSSGSTSHMHSLLFTHRRTRIFSGGELFCPPKVDNRF